MFGVRKTLRQVRRKARDLRDQGPAEFGQAALGLLIKVVAANLEVARRKAEEQALRSDREDRMDRASAPSRFSDKSKGELRRLLVSDALCRGRRGEHLACLTVDALIERGDDEGTLVPLLEDAFLIAGRPPCVRRAAALGIASLKTPAAERALERMTAIAARRAEWERDHQDHYLLLQLRRALAA
ncbi:MAG: hypothetical protein KC416_00680 [Myxococcales bacterium]|nr:hypothetical protein [Myxococcales bacterium]